MNKRVVITGLGVVAPNGVGVPAFLDAIRHGRSGLAFMPLYEELNFNCQVAGVPAFGLNDVQGLLPEIVFNGFKSLNIAYGIKAAAEAWLDAGLLLDKDAAPYWDTGCVFGSSVSDSYLMKAVIEKVEKKEARKLGSRVVEQIMNSGPAAYISGLLGLGNRVMANSSACATGTQAILMGYESIRCGSAKKMLVGSCESVDHFIFGAFDSMRVLSRKYNDEPQRASRPMSVTASGFVPGSGAGALILEELDSALQRGAQIYAEVIGGATNTGGQRCGGTMTAPNSEGMVRCITEAMHDAGITGAEVDLAAGHLTATIGDKTEVRNWVKALNRSGDDFPMINSLKSMTGHCLSAAGAIESVAAVLQIAHRFIHPNINLEDPIPEITDMIGIDRMPLKTIERDVNIVAKANFGFGDVNACLIFSRYK